MIEIKHLEPRKVDYVYDRRGKRLVETFGVYSPTREYLGRAKRSVPVNLDDGPIGEPSWFIKGLDRWDDAAPFLADMLESAYD